MHVPSLSQHKTAVDTRQRAAHTNTHETKAAWVTPGICTAHPPQPSMLPVHPWDVARGASVKLRKRHPSSARHAPRTCTELTNLPLDLDLALRRLGPRRRIVASSRAGYAAASRRAIPPACSSRWLCDRSTSALLWHWWHLRGSRAWGRAPSSCMQVAGITKVIIAGSAPIPLYAAGHTELRETTDASCWGSPRIASPPIVCDPLALQHVTLRAGGLSMGCQRRWCTPLHSRRGGKRRLAHNTGLRHPGGGSRGSLCADPSPARWCGD